VKFINFSSIFLKIHFIFGITFLLLVVSFFLLEKEIKKENFQKIFHETKLLSDKIRQLSFTNRNLLIKQLEFLNYKINKNEEIIKKIVNREDIQFLDFDRKPPHHGRHNRHYSKKKEIEIIKIDNKIYFWLKYFRDYPLWHYFIIIEKQQNKTEKFPIRVIFISLFITIFVIYILLLNSLYPLKSLKKTIKKFGETKTFDKPKKIKKDEISIITQEFYTATQKIENLENSRKLFLRNIIHELKTPLTKGKLQLSLIDETDSNIEELKFLNTVFNRLDNLINELANIERLTSGNFSDIKLDFIESKISNFIENSIQIGLFEKNKIDIKNSNYSDFVIKAEFTLFAIAMKNLIDNGIKYSENKKITISISDKKISFISVGKELPNKFDNYLKPFNHSQITTKKGFGLGIYITNEILKKHNFSLSYDYSHLGKTNIFSINF
jgi:two-component system OmpR family sensor kinase